MLPVGLANTSISTGYAQKSPRSLKECNDVLVKNLVFNNESSIGCLDIMRRR